MYDEPALLVLHHTSISILQHGQEVYLLAVATRKQTGHHYHVVSIYNGGWSQMSFPLAEKIKVLLILPNTAMIGSFENVPYACYFP